ncbi:MAG: hypothetical protein KDG89_02690 [Geminicoccaceae bacterium]|nr:hypothetical protein [Geminicoccaceae bacterium]
MKALDPPTGAGNGDVPRPPHPRLVLLLAVLLPGVGHVAAGFPRRGLVFLFYTVLFGWLTARYAYPDASFVGRHAGGFLVYALSIPDAYRLARLRYARWRADRA